MTIGEKIYKYRKRAGLSQEELADRMSVTRQSVSLWETDQTTPTLESLIMLAEIFSVSLDELCGTAENAVGTERADDIARPTATEKPNAAEEAESLVCVQTKYTVKLFNSVNKLTSRKFYILSAVALLISIIIEMGIILSEADDAFLIFPALLILVIVSVIVRVSLSIKKSTAEFFELNPNCLAKVDFFGDCFALEKTSDNSKSTVTVRYKDVKKVKITDNYILIYYGNSVLPIENNLPDADYDLLLKLLNVPRSDKNARESSKIKTVLLVFFILSLLSIVMALITVTICVQSSPIPEFSGTLIEYMWVFYAYIPIPLASVILGIVYLIKKYKCKKNIIAGGIMCVLLLIYGSFTFIFKQSAVHDFGYVHELEQAVCIDLPDSGYIAFEIILDGDTNSVAMIKFDDANEIHGIISADDRFYTDTDFIPTNFLSLHYVALTSDYNYFMVYDVTADRANDFTDRQTEEHRYIYLAYSITKNILFALDFVK